MSNWEWDGDGIPMTIMLMAFTFILGTVIYFTIDDALSAQYHRGCEDGGGKVMFVENPNGWRCVGGVYGL
jgi:hypothetical protein